MSFDYLIGDRRLYKFSPILNLNDFRYNAIYVKNLLKLSFPCVNEEILNDPQCNQKKSILNDCNEDMETDEQNDVNNKNNTSSGESKDDDRCSSGLGYDVRVQSGNKFQVAADKLVKFTSERAPPGEIETKYRERLIKPEDEVIDEMLNYNKPIINESSMEKYKNGFLNLINDWKGNISEANVATNNVKLHGIECVKKSPVYSTVQLFGGTLECDDKFSYIISKNRMKSFRKNRNFKTSYISKVKYSNFEEYSFDTRTNYLIDEIPNEIRLTIRVYMPKVRRDIRLPYNFNAGYPVIDKAFFFCVCVKREEEGIPNYTDFMMYKVPSSFIFIHDTFYIDKSRPNLTDISEEYREFIEKRPHLYRTAKIGDMENTKLSDLNLRLGMAYVYVHMGGQCEHMFSISDIRMITFNDYHNINTYPVKVLQPWRKRKCHICGSDGPRYIIADCKLLPKCPRLMCEKCYKTFNYTLSIKNTDSIVYPYVDRNLIV